MNGEQLDENAVIPLIEELKKYDNRDGYKLKYEQVKKNLEPTVNSLISKGEDSVDYLIPLIKNEETWSCLFTLEILKEIKSEKAIMPLVNFIKNNNDSDYYKNGETAMLALTAIGKPAIDPLIEEIISSFQNKRDYIYLIGALTEIKDEKVYAFMNQILQDYINNSDKYDDWFQIEHFVADFDKQENKEVLPLLKKLLSMNHLSSHEKIEVRSTIESLEDPEKVKNEIEEMRKGFKELEQLKEKDINEKELLEQAVDYESRKEYENALDCISKILAVYPKSYHALFLETRIMRKTGHPNLIAIDEALKEARKQKASREIFNLFEEERKLIEKLFRQKQLEADEDFELHFKCLDCNKKQNLKPGLVWHFGDDFAYENEIMCRHCLSHNLEPTKDGLMQIMGKSMRMAMGIDSGIIQTGKDVFTENKKMPFKKSHVYLLRRIKENPHNAELYLRTGNSGRKHNKYEDAIKYYKKAIELNPKIIATYMNLFEIYSYRHDYYKMEEAKEEALFYLKKLREVYDSNDYNAVTVRNPYEIIQFIREKEVDFGISEFRKLEDKEVQKFIKKASIRDMESVSENLTQESIESEKEVKKLLKENKGIIVLQNYHVFDNKTQESKQLSTSSIMPIEQDKLCICGSGKYIKECCFNKVRRQVPFVANLDYETYSLYHEMELELEANESFEDLVAAFEKYPKFYCDDKTNKSAFFLYYGMTFYTEPKLGTAVFGTMEIKKRLFSNKCAIKLNALSKNRFDSLHDAVREILGE